MKTRNSVMQSLTPIGKNKVLLPMVKPQILTPMQKPSLAGPKRSLKTSVQPMALTPI